MPSAAAASCAGLNNRASIARPPSPGSVPDRLLAGMHAPVSGCLAAVSYHAYGMTPAQIRVSAEYMLSQEGRGAVQIARVVVALRVAALFTLGVHRRAVR